MRIPQRNVNTVTTNVPGPQSQLYACGRPMLEAFPFVPLASIGPDRRRDLLLQRAAQLRRHRRLRHRRDIAVLCRGIEAGMTELLKRV